MSMSTYTTDKASPFTRAVVRSMRKLLVTSCVRRTRQVPGLSILIRYPEALAEGFDNTGCRYRTLISNCMNIPTDWNPQVLLEAPFDPIRRQMNSVLLTIDLTKAVADEAIERKDCVVVSYRMPVDF